MARFYILVKMGFIGCLRSKNGVSSADLAEKTGFDKQKLANITFRLRKQGKIKSVNRGVYTKV